MPRRTVISCRHRGVRDQQGWSVLLVLISLAATLCASSLAGKLHVSNLNASCVRCLCYSATSCSHARCRDGYCGPFYISRIYWADADRHVLRDDTPQRDKAWEDCALDYSCASAILTKYMRKYGRDCTGDGVTDCDDFASIHYHGGFGCDKSLGNTDFGDRYLKCKRGQANGVLGLHDG